MLVDGTVSWNMNDHRTVTFGEAVSGLIPFVISDGKGRVTASGFGKSDEDVRRRASIAWEDTVQDHFWNEAADDIAAYGESR